MSTQVRKGNKILKVSDDAVERYLKMGYNVLNGSGEVVTKAVPVDVNQLKLEYSRMSNEIEGLKGQIEQLKTEKAELTKTNDFLIQENKKLVKELTTLKSAPISAETEKTTTTRRRKQNTSETEAKG